MQQDEQVGEVIHPVARCERFSFFALTLFATMFLGMRVEDRLMAVFDLVVYLVILVTTFHLTRELDPLERTGRVILYSVGCFFLIRAGALALSGERSDLTGELIRVALRWGS
jgi:hypothetical protein